MITHLPPNRKIARVLYFNSGEVNDLSFKNLTPYHAGIEIVRENIHKVAFAKAYGEMHLLLRAQAKEKEKEKSQKPRIFLRRLTPSEIKDIKKELKKPKQKEKRALRSGRLY